MKLQLIKKLQIDDIICINYERFSDPRGYFTESYNSAEFTSYSELKHFIKHPFVQHNESFSHKNVLRGLHFQWNPFMGKLVRTVFGHMIDLIVDIRPKSKTFGKGLMCDMPAHHTDTFSTWIWIPPGFAHGNYFLEETTIEYLCTGNYNASCEMGINPFSSDIDWSLAEKKLYKTFLSIKSKCIMSEKDKRGKTIVDWQKDKNSKLFQ